MASEGEWGKLGARRSTTCYDMFLSLSVFRIIVWSHNCMLQVSNMDKDSEVRRDSVNSEQLRDGCRKHINHARQPPAGSAATYSHNASIRELTSMTACQSPICLLLHGGRTRFTECTELGRRGVFSNSVHVRTE